MAQVFSSVGQAGRQVEQAGRQVLDHGQAAAQEVAASPWTRKLARLGLGAKGLIYGTIGVLAVKAAFGRGGETTDSRGAIQTLGEGPFGKALLVVLALGLIGYTLWRFVQAFADTEGKGGNAKGLAVRAGYAGSGLLHASLALMTIRLLMGSGSGAGGRSTQDWTAELLSKPFGPWLVGLIGAGVIGFGLFQLYRAYSASFRKHFNLPGMSLAQEKWATLAGRLGHAARGIVFGLIGLFLIQAARHSDPGEVRGLDGALQALAEKSHGPWLLGFVALGLIAYGVYCLVEARYRRVVPAGAPTRQGRRTLQP
jgi:hypothetical protein